MGKALGRGLKSMNKKKSFRGLRALIRTSDEDEDTESEQESEYKEIKTEYNKKKRELMEKRDLFYQLKKDIVFNQLKEDEDLNEDQNQLAQLEVEIQDMERDLDKILLNMTKIEKDLKTDDGQDLVTVRQNYIKEKDIDQDGVPAQEEENGNGDKPMEASSDIKDDLLKDILNDAFKEPEDEPVIEGGEIHKALDDDDPGNETEEAYEVKEDDLIAVEEESEDSEYAADIKDIKDLQEEVLDEPQAYEIDTDDPAQKEEMPKGEEEKAPYFEPEEPEAEEKPEIEEPEEPEAEEKPEVEEPEEPEVEEPEVPEAEEPELPEPTIGVEDSEPELPEPTIGEPEIEEPEEEPEAEPEEPDVQTLEEPEADPEEPDVQTLEEPEAEPEEPDIQTLEEPEEPDDVELFDPEAVAREIEELEESASKVMEKIESGFKDQPAEEPTVEEPVVEPTVEEPVVEPTVEEPVVEPTVEEPAELEVRDAQADQEPEVPTQDPIDDDVDDIELEFKFESKPERSQPEEVRQLESESIGIGNPDVVEYSQEDIESWKKEPEVHKAEREDPNSKFDAPKMEKEFKSDKLYDDSKIKSKIDEIRGIEKGLVEVDNEISKLHNSLKEMDDSGEYWEVLHEKGFALSRIGNYEEAIYYYNKALQINPSNEEILSNKGVALFTMDDLEEAKKCFAEALKIKPNYEKAWNNLGVVMRSEGKLFEALRCYNQAIKSNPTYKNAWYNKGFILEDMGRFEEALKYYNKAIDISPNYSEAIYSRDECLAKLAARRIKEKESVSKAIEDEIRQIDEELEKEIQNMEELQRAEAGPPEFSGGVKRVKRKKRKAKKRAM